MSGLVPRSVFLILLLAPAPVACQTITPDEARAIAEEAYVFAYPMLENYKTMYAQAIDKSSGDLARPVQRPRPHEVLAIRNSPRS